MFFGRHLKTFAFGLSVITMTSISVSAQPIKIKAGVLNDRSGVYSDLTGEGSVVAARMAVEDFKALSSDIEVEVEVVAADHQNKPDVGSNIARQWYDRDGVDVILDVPTSSVALAVNQITRDKNKALIVSGGGAAELTGKACSPNTVHWTYDTYALAQGTGGAMTRAGGDTWFFITADYAFGHALERDTSAIVTKNGGKVLGQVRTPFPANDFSSFLLQAQASNAKVIGLANAGGDTVNAVKQAAEFGITQGGQKLAGLIFFSNDVHGLGLEVAQGLVLTEAFYWDSNDETRAWSERFEKIHGTKPTMIHAGVYAGLLHYLKAVAATGSKDGDVVVAKMKELATEDPAFGKGSIRADGRKMHDMFLFEVKKPSESQGDWDYYHKLAVLPAEEAFRPLAEGECPLVK